MPAPDCTAQRLCAICETPFAVTDPDDRLCATCGEAWEEGYEKGKQERFGLQVKSSAEGKCEYDGVPYGKLRIQVLATGFQTFGQDYEITQPEQEIVIRMKRPQEQYSIYTDKQNDTKKDAPPPEQQNKPQ